VKYWLDIERLIFASSGSDSKVTNDNGRQVSNFNNILKRMTYTKTNCKVFM